MKVLLLPVLILIGLPLVAQSGGGEARFWQAIRKSSQPHILVFDDASKPMTAQAKKLLQEEEDVADLGLTPKTLSQKEVALAGAVRRRLSLAPSVRWAIVDSKEQCLASGQVLPTASGLLETLAAKGIRSPVRVLREFLKESPDHLEARMDLLRLQLKSAERRTGSTLGLVHSEAEEQPNDKDDKGEKTLAGFLHRGLDDMYGSPKPKPIPGDKALEAEQDLKIWGGYADSFDRLFTGDDWVACGWGFDGGVPMESCSPLVKALYRRKLKAVEAALETAPLNTKIWSVWTRMADAVGGQSILAVVDRLALPPGGGFASWPVAVRNRLIDEARTKNRWDYIANQLWGGYEYASGRAFIIGEAASGETSSHAEDMKRIMDDTLTREWDTLFGPLLEALLRMGDTGRADTVMNILWERQGRGQWSDAQIRKAIDLANRCGRSDVAGRWSVLAGQTATTKSAANGRWMVGGRTIAYGAFLEGLAKNPPASLVLFDTKEHEWEMEIERVRREDPFVNLNLNFRDGSIDYSVGKELCEKEGWPAQKPRWAIFDAAGKMIADGGTLPTAAQLADVCATANIVGQVELYRRFLREHPSHEEARGVMLQQILAVAELRTRHYLQVPEYRDPRVIVSLDIEGVRTDNQSAGAPTADQIETLSELTSDADERIWGEYCAWLPRHLEGTLWRSSGVRPQGAPAFLDPEPIVSAWVWFSPTAKGTYSRVVPMVEAALSRQPSSPVLWGLWLAMHKVGAGKSIKYLLAALKPRPSVAPADWPPTSIRAPYLKECRETGDWKTVQDLVGPAWASMTERITDRDMSGLEKEKDALSEYLNIGDLFGFSQGFWLSNGEAYLEALLRQQRLSDADQMMKTWASCYGWPGAFPAAAAIAERLGYEDLAKAWRALGEKK